MKEANLDVKGSGTSKSSILFLAWPPHSSHVNMFQHFEAAIVCMNHEINGCLSVKELTYMFTGHFNGAFNRGACWLMACKCAVFAPVSQPLSSRGITSRVLQAGVSKEGF